MTEPLTYDWTFDQSAAPAINPVTDAAAANRAIQQVLAESSGPAPSPPRPNPTQALLPVGITIDGQLVREARVRELTGADEEALAAVDRNSLEFFDTILRRGVAALGSKIPTDEQLQDMLVGDRDSLLLAIRVATFGSPLEIQGVKCPSCTSLIDVTIDLSTVEQRALPGGEPTVTLRDGRIARVRFPTGADQRFVLTERDATPARVNSRLLERCVTAVGETPVEDGAAFAQSLGIADRRTLLMYLADHAPGPQLTDVSVTHESCGEEIPLPISVADAFLDL
ncbi:hypothetical protein ADL22_12390 [Streptomyces sp. NRRL F-4489]|uniref:T4 family baseplate hub assembly chaperone n=1 Tax=Streptomyces sp. NRRL F-4489 TaxID=1609095 RepID=UPI0007463706|nr:hypothetical protein [Streptomyces sp. NRRL F-4489]KUL44736.1 hypothetical protein ADL22_12390 [Streptomyces sp. NRRL F-4489]